MANKTYSIRVPSTVEVESSHLVTWLDEFLKAGGDSLAPDPGAGPKTLRVSLDSAKVEQAATAAGESETVFLRRLVASRVRIKEEEKTEKPRPKPHVLPKDLRIGSEQLEPIVAALDQMQSFALSRVVRVPEAREAAKMTPGERADLSRAAAGVINRRAPAWFIEHADIFGLASLVVVIEGKHISAAYEAAAERRKQAQKQKATPAVVEFAPGGEPLTGGGLVGDEQGQ